MSEDFDWNKNRFWCGNCGEQNEEAQAVEARALKAEEALRKVDSICKKADTAEDDLDFAGALLAVGVAVRAALSEKAST